jgi:hypothetical protein
MSSVIGRNIYFCAERYCLNPEALMTASRDCNHFSQLVYSQTNAAAIDCAARVLELIFVRDGLLTLGSLTRSDVHEMISRFVTK